MKEYENIHLLACDYAENCEKQILANREQLNERPLTHDQLQMTWLNHYDGFSAGYRAALQENTK